MSRSLSALIITAVILIGSPEMSRACGPAEYQVNQVCCPPCGPGYHVFRHCTEYTSTTCAPCPSSTYNDELNGTPSCLPCTVCDSSAGVRVKRACSSTSDTLCEPLEGHYCTDPIKDGCRGAVEHTQCSPGQYIRQQGSASSDTVCGDCGNDTYSDGSFTSCRPNIHTNTSLEDPEAEAVQEKLQLLNHQCQDSLEHPQQMAQQLCTLTNTIMATMAHYQRQKMALQQTVNALQETLHNIKHKLAEAQAITEAQAATQDL